MRKHGTVRRSGPRRASPPLGVVALSLAVGSAGVASTAAGERDRPATGAERAFTLGVVQKELRSGLPQADVAERLGSPNIVTRDGEGREAWVYDRVSCEVETSGRSVGVGGAGSGIGGSFWGLLGVGAGRRQEKTKTSQKTLTVVVRFSTAGTVEGFSWHASRF